MQQAPVDDDHLHFPLLITISSNLQLIHSLQPSDIDNLAVEISLAFQRASVPESTVSTHERQVNDLMMGSIGMIDHELSLKHDTGRDGATLILLRKTMVTPKNLHALLRMCDADIRTGKVRCHAFWHLKKLLSVQSTWKVKLVDSNKVKCSFASKIMTVMAKALSDQRISLCGHPSQPNCSCNAAPWTMFGDALAVCRDTPRDVIDLLHPWDWTTILQRPSKDPERSTYNCTLFVGLRRWPVRLLQEDNSNPKAKEVLKQLGSCDTLLKLVLRKIVAGEMSSTPGGIMSFEDLGTVVNFLTGFLYSLKPLPWTRDIDSLIRRARSSIMEALAKITRNRVRLMAQDAKKFTHAMNSTNEVILMMEKWKYLHQQESDEARWQRFHKRFLAQGSNPDDNKCLSKVILKNRKKEVKASTNLTEGEMCANCYVLENTVEGGLLKCGRCMLIKYCSGECQKEHWKKAHKKQCKK
jgi:hypothetical protein